MRRMFQTMYAYFFFPLKGKTLVKNSGIPNGGNPCLSTVRDLKLPLMGFEPALPLVGFDCLKLPIKGSSLHLRGPQALFESMLSLCICQLRNTLHSVMW